MSGNFESGAHDVAPSIIRATVVNRDNFEAGLGVGRTCHRSNRSLHHPTLVVGRNDYRQRRGLLLVDSPEGAVVQPQDGAQK